MVDRRGEKGSVIGWHGQATLGHALEWAAVCGAASEHGQEDLTMPPITGLSRWPGHPPTLVPFACGAPEDTAVPEAGAKSTTPPDESMSPAACFPQSSLLAPFIRINEECVSKHCNQQSPADQSACQYDKEHCALIAIIRIGSLQHCADEQQCANGPEYLLCAS